MKYQEAITYLRTKADEWGNDTILECISAIQQSRMVVKAPATPNQLSKPWGRKATDILMAAMRLGLHGVHVNFAFDAASIVALAQELGITCDVECNTESNDTDLDYLSKDAAFEDGWTKGRARGHSDRIDALKQAISIIANYIDMDDDEIKVQELLQKI